MRSNRQTTRGVLDKELEQRNRETLAGSSDMQCSINPEEVFRELDLAMLKSWLTQSEFVEWGVEQSGHSMGDLVQKLMSTKDFNLAKIVDKKLEELESRAEKKRLDSMEP